MQKSYSREEERINIWSHALGILLSVVGTFFLFEKATNSKEFIGVGVFSAALVILYTASTMYHSAKNPLLRSRFRVFDHAAIFLLIAGTYTPVCLLSLEKSIGDTLLVIIWALGGLGITLKIFFTGRFNRLSTILYVGMGWVAIFAVKPLLGTMSPSGLFWLALGGFFYTVGAVLYSRKNLKFNHAIFHFFVLLGSACHFAMVYLSILD